MNARPVSFPAEPAEYDAPREELLRAEIDLRRRIEEVAALRRDLPLGGEVTEDYRFQRRGDGGEVETVGLAELFQPDQDSLLVYSFMYGPEMAEPCVMCTSILDGLEAQWKHAKERVGLVAVAKSPLDRIEAFAWQRGWRDLPLLSSHGTTYNEDYYGEDAEGRQMPMLNVFVRRDGRVHHFWGSEMLYADTGRQSRHVDLLWPLWNLFDLTPEGRGTDWYPRLAY